MRAEMNKEMIKFGLKNVVKHKFHSSKKKNIYVNDVNIGIYQYQTKKNFKYFVVGVNYSNGAIGPLLIKLPKPNGSIKGLITHLGLIKNIKLL